MPRHIYTLFGETDDAKEQGHGTRVCLLPSGRDPHTFRPRSFRITAIRKGSAHGRAALVTGQVSNIWMSLTCGNGQAAGLAPDESGVGENPSSVTVPKGPRRKKCCPHPEGNGQRKYHGFWRSQSSSKNTRSFTLITMKSWLPSDVSSRISSAHSQLKNICSSVRSSISLSSLMT